MTIGFDVEARLLKFAAVFAGRLPDQDIANSTDLISRREWGVGLEVLCAQLAEHEIQLSTREVEELKQLASAMNMDIAAFGLVG